MYLSNGIYQYYQMVSTFQSLHLDKVYIEHLSYYNQQLSENYQQVTLIFITFLITIAMIKASS